MPDSTAPEEWWQNPAKGPACVNLSPIWGPNGTMPPAFLNAWQQVWLAAYNANPTARDTDRAADADECLAKFRERWPE